MKTTIQEIHPLPGQRLIAVSDIHGNLDLLVQLLHKADYSGNDILIVAGDIIDKGPDSLRTLQYLLDLSRRNQVCITIGNVDLHRLQALTDTSEGSLLRLLAFTRQLKEHWGGGLIPDMFADLGISIDHLTEENIDTSAAQIRSHFREEIAFLQNLPVILKAGDYLFVHGGIPTEDADILLNTDAEAFLKNDCFLPDAPSFHHCVVVGHWPVCLYDREKESLRPIFDYERRIISIDGGAGIKKAGQLNGLIIPDCHADMRKIRWISDDAFPEIVAEETQDPAPPTLHIQYFDSLVEQIDTVSEDLIRLRHVSSGKEFLSHREFLYHTGTGLHHDDYCDAKLPVKTGDELHAVLSCPLGCYAKKDGILGWYCGNYHGKPSDARLLPGRPLQEKMRMEREIAVYDLLDRLSIPYSHVDHREGKTMEACAWIDAILEAVICKNLFLRNQQKTRFYLLMMPGDKKFKTKELSRQINSARLSFAEPEYMQKLLHINPGSVSVMGLMNDVENQVQLLIDRDVLSGEYFGCHPCVNTSSIRLKMQDLLQVFLPAVHHAPLIVDLKGE